jgi:hypothetical protein
MRPNGNSGDPHIHRCVRGSNPCVRESSVVRDIDATAATQSPPTMRMLDQVPQVVHCTVTVTFNCDFSKYPPCSTKIVKKCIKQFDVWEVSVAGFLVVLPLHQVIGAYTLGELHPEYVASNTKEGSTLLLGSREPTLFMQSLSAYFLIWNAAAVLLQQEAMALRDAM